MYKTQNNIAPKSIKGNIAILCSSENLTSVENLIMTFNTLNNISLFIEKNNSVSIHYVNSESFQIKYSKPNLQLDCSLKQCFSPLEYSCTVCIGKNKSFSSIAELCSKYATPIYMLESYGAA